MSEQDPGSPDGRRRVLVVLLWVVVCLAPFAAAGIGFFHAYSQWRSQPFPADSAFPCSPLPTVRVIEKGQTPVTEQAAVAETLQINTRSLPFSYTTTEVVTVPADNTQAQTLMLQPGSDAAKTAAACLFTRSVSGVPQLISAAHGMTTFKDSGTSPLPVTEWDPTVHSRGIQLAFDSSLVCDSYPFRNWAGTTLTVTIRADTALSPVNPQPDSIVGRTYVWRSAAQACELPQISVTVPTGLAGYLSSIVSAPGAVGESTLPQALGWADPVITGLIALWLILRIPWTAAKRFALALVVLALLGIGPAAVDLTLAQDALRGPAELVAFYTVALGLVVFLSTAIRPKETVTAGDDGAADAAASGGPRLSGRAAPAKLSVGGVGAIAALLICAYRIPVWFPGASVLLTVAAAVLLGAVGVATCRLARAVDVTDEPKLPTPAWASIGKVRDFIVFWVGVAALVAVAFSAGYWVQIGTVQSVVLSEYSVFRYPLAALAQVLVPIALVLPLAATGSSTRRITAAAAFGLAMAANQSDVLVGNGWGVPLGTVLLAILAYALVREDNESPAARPDAVANAVLAVKIAALLAIIPVGYFSFTTIAHLSASQNPVFVVSSILGQFTGWLVIAVFYGMLSSRLPGRIGPVKALILASTWFAVAILVNMANNGLHSPAGRAWIFAGLQFALFLIAFSVIWDAFALKKSTVPETIKELRASYHLEQAQSVALYAIPVLLALVALVQQVASGSGSDFVTSILNGAAAAFGGR